jgi:hypothetical protein
LHTTLNPSSWATMVTVHIERYGVGGVDGE